MREGHQLIAAHSCAVLPNVANSKGQLDVLDLAVLPVKLPSSQASLLSTPPLPQPSERQPQEQPHSGSSAQAGLQPSPVAVPPSPHCSAGIQRSVTADLERAVGSTTIANDFVTVVTGLAAIDGAIAAGFSGIPGDSSRRLGRPG